jgi:hypothetical protein
VYRENSEAISALLPIIIVRLNQPKFAVRNGPPMPEFSFGKVSRKHFCMTIVEINPANQLE